MRWPEALATAAVQAWENSDRFHLGGVDGQVRLELSERHFPRAWAVGGHEHREEIQLAAEELERQAKARVVRSGRGSSAAAQAVILSPEAVEEAYSLVGARSRRASLRSLCGELAQLELSQAPLWLREYRDQAVSELEQGRTAALGAKVSLEHVRDAFLAAERIAKAGSYEERSLSGAMFGWTKRLREIRGRVRHILYSADPYWSAWPAVPDDRIFFSHYGETFKPPVTSIAATLTIPGVMEMREFVPYAAVPRAVLLRIGDVLATRSETLITTIENESAFLRYLTEAPTQGRITDGTEVVLYTGGYASDDVMDFLRRLAPGAHRLRHWGDADYDGLRIALLIGEAGGGAQLYRTTPRWVAETDAHLGNRLRDEDRSALGSLQLDPCLRWCPEVAEVAGAVLANDVWFEQEVFYATDSDQPL